MGEAGINVKVNAKKNGKKKTLWGITRHIWGGVPSSVTEAKLNCDTRIHIIPRMFLISWFMKSASNIQQPKFVHMVYFGEMLTAYTYSEMGATSECVSPIPFGS